MSKRCDPDLRQFVTDVLADMTKYLEAEEQADNTEDPSAAALHVCGWTPPSELLEIVHSNYSIGSEPVGLETLRSDINFVLTETVKMGHRRCLNQLFHRADTLAIVGDWLTACMNTSIYTYELGPMVTMLEIELVDRYRQLIGWSEASGTFPPGGSYSNLYGILCGRTRKFPHVPAEGWHPNDNPVLFVSAAGHYSSKKTAAMIGMGYNNIRPVPCDEMGQMDPAQLEAGIEKALSEGKTPFCVVSTVGTTLTGAIDPLDKISDICTKYNLWHHVDGCLGGSLLHSPTLRHALKGIEKADSVSINAHKMMGVTLQCSCFITRHEAIQKQTFCTAAAYLFNADKQYDAATYDVGDKIFQCGRRPDCVKLWLTWRARGDVGMAKYIDDGDAVHRLFNECLAERTSEFRVVLPKPSAVPCTCFWWLPEGTSPDVSVKDPALFEVIDKVVPRAKLGLMRSGKALLTMSKMDDLPNFWRFVGTGAVPWTKPQIHKFLDDIAEACRSARATL